MGILYIHVAVCHWEMLTDSQECVQIRLMLSGESSFCEFCQVAIAPLIEGRTCKDYVVFLRLFMGRISVDVM